MNKKRMKWPYVQSYGEDTSIPESMVTVTAISGGIRIHDEDLGKDLPFINEAVVYANSKYTLMNTDPAAYRATYAFDSLLTIRNGVCGDNTEFPNAPCAATLALSSTILPSSPKIPRWPFLSFRHHSAPESLVVIFAPAATLIQSRTK